MTYVGPAGASKAERKIMACDGPWCGAQQPIEDPDHQWLSLIAVDEMQRLTHRHFHRMICLASWATRECLRLGPDGNGL